MFVCWILVSFLLPCIVCYNIALHAQVFPDGEKVVGSVITTDGLRAAFLKRREVEKCEIFYPGHYHGYSNTTWDFLIIEGWFLNIYEFLQVSRNLFPEMKIFFYCLDPVYPGMSQVVKFNVDGIATNSRPMRNALRSIGIRSQFIMLAADPDVMKPNTSISRTYGATYVGAGSHMLSQKPELRDMLLEAIPYGLRLHGVGWNHVELFKDFNLGPLPRFELANAYSSANLVLTSVIKSQDDMHMINNRVFEALSCGAIVVAQHSQALSELFSDIIQFKTGNMTFHQLYRHLLVEKSLVELEKLRIKSREVILKHHTWNHRAVQFLSFMTQIKHSSTAKTYNSPKMLWIESKECFQSLDYQFLKNSFLLSFLSKRFSIDLIDEDTFSQEFLFPSPCIDSSKCEQRKLYDYHIVFVIIEPYSDLDNLIATLPVSILVSDQSQLQRRMAYVTGVNPARFQRCFDAPLMSDSCHNLSHYDVLLFRDYYDMEIVKEATQRTLPQSRLQHLFGVPSNEITTQSQNLLTPLIVCSLNHAGLCNRPMRANILQQYHLNFENQLLVLTGGHLEDWMIDESVVGSNEMSHVAHFNGDQISEDFLFLVRNHSSMIIIIQNGSHSEHGIPFTSSNFILPIVMGALFNKSLHLSHMNEHLIGVSSQGCEDWGLPYLFNSTTNALNRLLGFPPRSARVHLRALELGRENQCLNCNNRDLHLLQNCEVMRERKRPFTIVAINPINFEIGRDGTVCLNVVNGSEDLQLCFLRGVDYVVIEQNFTTSKLISASFVFTIRGGLFSDVSYASNHSFTLNAPWHSYEEKLFSPFPRNQSIDRDIDCRFHSYQLKEF